VRDKHERQPAHLAARGGFAECLAVLGGAALLECDGDGRTALHCAAFSGHTPCLQLGLELCGPGALALRDESGQDCSHYAAKKGHSSTLEFLRTAVAQAEQQTPTPLGRDHEGWTAEDILHQVLCTVHLPILVSCACKSHPVSQIESGWPACPHQAAFQQSEFKPTNIAAKRWQREVLMRAAATPLRLAERARSP
jgi:hypothetical protein